LTSIAIGTCWSAWEESFLSVTTTAAPFASDSTAVLTTLTVLLVWVM
jgi:hypothetical protein